MFIYFMLVEYLGFITCLFDLTCYTFVCSNLVKRDYYYYYYFYFFFQICAKGFVCIIKYGCAWFRPCVHTHKPRFDKNLVFIILIIFPRVLQFCLTLFRLIIHVYLLSILYLVNLAMFSLFVIFFLLCLFNCYLFLFSIICLILFNLFPFLLLCDI